MGQLEGKVCLITGASQGIGAAAATLFAREGAIVYAAARGTEKTKAWVDASGLSDRVLPIALDVRESDSVKEVLLRIRKEAGRIDALVNNAAIERNESIGSITRDGLRDMFETNVFGVIDLVQIAARIMRRTGGGSIVNVASVVGERGNAGQLAYSASKGAVIALTRSAARELASWGIRVNAVAPGLTDTGLLRAVPEDKLRPRMERICMGRPAQPLEIAQAMLFLASDASAFISGQILNVDGCTIG